MLHTTHYIIHNTAYMIHNSGFWLLASGFLNPDSGFWIPDSGSWILDSGCWILGAEAHRGTPWHTGTGGGGRIAFLGQAELGSKKVDYSSALYISSRHMCLPLRHINLLQEMQLAVLHSTALKELHTFLKKCIF